MWDIASGGWASLPPPPQHRGAWIPWALATVQLLPLTPECLGHIMGLPSVYKTEQRASSKSTVNVSALERRLVLLTGLPRSTVVNDPPANAGDPGDAGSVPESGRSPGGGTGDPLQCSCLENPMVRGAWGSTVYVVAKSRTDRACAHTLVIKTVKRADSRDQGRD